MKPYLCKKERTNHPAQAVQLAEHHPIYQLVGSIPGHGNAQVSGLIPSRGKCGRQMTDVSLSPSLFSLFLPPSL